MNVLKLARFSAVSRWSMVLVISLSQYSDMVPTTKSS